MVAMAIAGNQGCPCINTTSTLASLTHRHCELPKTGELGIQLTLSGSCVPFSYGSSKCMQHDLVYDPNCKTSNPETIITPAYCFRPFCYIDLDKCVGQSDERVFRSSYFKVDSGADVFYSYSTCNSTAEDWLAAEDDVLGQSNEGVALGGKSIIAAFPTYQVPLMYKRDPISQEVLTSPGSEFYDNAVPYEGVYMNYVQRIAEISNGDISNITIKHRSRASSLVHPTSSFTATVQDIQDGLIDMGVGPFWITAQRLKMSPFTLPIVYDKTVLVIPRPEKEDSLSYQTAKVLAPFSLELWAMILGVIAFTSILTVWFSDRSQTAVEQNQRRMGLRRGGQPLFRRKKRVYARLCLDSFLEKGLFYCSAGVEQDEKASLPIKFLLFGFGFFVLIAVSAYVANLAAFLTLSAATDTVKTIEQAVAKGVKICAHPALELEMRVAFPEADFYFHKAGKEFPGMLEDYDAKKCAVMAVGYEDTSLNADFLNGLCKRNLVYTDSLIIEIPVAFPIKSEYVAGFSHWMYTGDRMGDASLQTSKDLFYADISCSVEFSDGETEGSEYTEIEVKNMFFPIMFFTAFSVVAIILQLVHMWNVRQGKDSLVGRGSTLNLVAEVPERSDGKEMFSYRDKKYDHSKADISGSRKKRSSLFKFGSIEEKCSKEEEEVFIEDVAVVEAKVEDVFIEDVAVEEAKVEEND